MRLFLLCPLSLIALLFSNCKKEYTEVTQVVQANRTISKTLEPGNWKYDASSNTYYNEISVPEIDDSVVQKGGVLAYITFDNKRYEILPDVLDGSTFVCFYRNGVFDVEVQYADGSIASPPTGAIGLKIVLVDSQ